MKNQGQAKSVESHATPRRRSPGKTIAFAAAASAIAIAAIEGLLNFLWLGVDYRAAAKARPKAIELMEERHCRYDAEIGWTHVPGKRIADFYGPARAITINGQGFRALEEYAKEKPQGRFRVICLGDSFTLGYGVDDGETYPAQLQRINPGVQAVNMGQGGYSAGQCWLWERREGAKLDADLLLFGFIVDDLIARMSVERLMNGYAMPTFRLDGGKLAVGNQPVPAKIEAGGAISRRGEARDFLAAKSGLIRTLALAAPRRRASLPDPSQIDALLAVDFAIFMELKRECAERQRRLALMLMPDLQMLALPESAALYEQVAARIRSFAEAESIPFFDLREPFMQAGESAKGFYLREMFQHFSPTGNAFTAAKVDAWLKKAFSDYPGAVARP